MARKPAVEAVPPVRSRLPIGRSRLVDTEVPAKGPIRSLRADPASVLSQSPGPHGTRGGADDTAWRGFGVLGDDVDDAVHGIGAPDRATRSADDLDALDVLQRHVLLVPEHTRESGGIHGTAVDEYQHLVRIPVVEAANRDSPGVRIDLRHVDPGRHAKQVRDV